MNVPSGGGAGGPEGPQHPPKSRAKTIESILALFADYPMTAFTCLVAIAVALQPQFFHIILNIPLRQRGHGILVIPFLGAEIAAAVAAVVVGAILVVPTDPQVTLPPLFGWIGKACDRVNASVLTKPVDSYMTLAGRSRRVRLWLGGVLAVVALGWLVVPLAFSRPLLGQVCDRLGLSLVALLTAAYFFTAGRLDKRHDKVHGRFLFIVGAGALVGELVWRLPEWFPGFYSYQLYTIWAFPFVLVLLISVGRVLDSWKHPVRPWARIFALVVPLLLLAMDARSSVPAKELAPANDGLAAWLRSFGDRIETAPDGPVVIVAASGGGSRAAIFASLALELLAHQPIAAPTDVAQKPARTLAGNIALISSVSGGSVATAYFAQTQGNAPAPRAEPFNYDPQDILARTQRLSGTLARDIDPCFGSAQECRPKRMEGADEYEQSRDAVLGAARKLTGLTIEKAAKDDDLGWIFSSAFVDDMSTDFMAPLLRGVLAPGLERGDSVSAFWAQRFGWSGVVQGKGTTEKPLVFFNATDVENGRRLVIGFPITPLALFDPVASSLGSAESGRGMALADAVRLSANFPWGFEIGTFPRNGGPSGETFKIIDGGVRDNTGLDTVSLALDRIERLAESVEEAPANEAARRVRNLMLVRGVLLVEVDSGAKPERSGVLGFFPAVAEPLDALAYAHYGGADDLKHAYLDHMSATFLKMGRHKNLDDGLRQAAATRQEGFVVVSLVCNRTDDVMTAWALGPQDKAKVVTMFAIERERLRQKLADIVGQATDAQRATQAVRAAKTDVMRRYERQVLEAAADETQKLNEKDTDAAVSRQALYERLDSPINAAPVGANPPTPVSAPVAQVAPPPPPPPTRVVPCDSKGTLWAYLGEFDQKWLRRYFSDPRAPQQLAKNDPLTALGRINLRDAMPDNAANFGKVARVLRAKERVVVCDAPKPWGDTGYWWVRVAAAAPPQGGRDLPSAE